MKCEKEIKRNLISIAQTILKKKWKSKSGNFTTANVKTVSNGKIDIVAIFDLEIIYGLGTMLDLDLVCFSKDADNLNSNICQICKKGTGAEWWRESGAGGRSRRGRRSKLVIILATMNY